MKNNFFQSALAERISLMFLTITACFLVYWFFLRKEQRECGPMIVTTETFFNPGTTPGNKQPEERLAISLKDKPRKVKHKNKEKSNDEILAGPVIVFQRQDEQDMVILNQINEAKILLREERDRMKEEAKEVRERRNEERRSPDDNVSAGPQK